MSESGGGAWGLTSDAFEMLREAGYEDIRQIGYGGFAVVYRAFQRGYNREVAIKVLGTGRLDARTAARFERERHAMGSLSAHPYIITIYDSGLTPEGQPFIVMGHTQRGSLESQLESEGSMDWRDAVDIGVKLAGALETAHRLGILHRDLKPANILVSDFGFPQLSDFGIAHVRGQSTATGTGEVVASLAYAAPEILTGDRPTPMTDVYSLGSTLFSLITSKPPYYRDTDESFVPLLYRIVREPVPDLRPSGVPDVVCDVIEKSMAKDPAERQQTAEVFGRELQEAQQQLGIRPTDMLVAEEPRPAAVAAVAAAPADLPLPVSLESATPRALAVEEEGETVRVARRRGETAAAPAAPATPAAPAAPAVPGRRRRVGLLAALTVVVLVGGVGGFVVLRREPTAPPPATATTLPIVAGGPKVTTIAGRDGPGSSGESGLATEAGIDTPTAVAVSSSGVLFGEQKSGRIYRVGGDGSISVLAGNGRLGSKGDGGPALEAEIVAPDGLAADASGRVFFSEHAARRVRVIGSDGLIARVAGTGEPGSEGDAGPALDARLVNPAGLALAADGVLYIADRGGHRIRKIAPDGIISTVAGTGEAGYSGDGGPAAQAKLNGPFGIAIGPDGSLYVADNGNARIRKIAPDGIISTVAGTGEAGYSGDGGPAAQAKLNGPVGVAVDASLRIWVADAGNARVRRIAPDGTIGTIAGTGDPAFSGDGGPATSAGMTPLFLALDSEGRVYYSDFANHRVRRLEED